MMTDAPMYTDVTTDWVNSPSSRDNRVAEKDFRQQGWTSLPVNKLSRKHFKGGKR